MKPKDLLAELEKNKGDDYNNGVYDGARMMWHLFRDKDSAWRDANREAVRKYNREYARARARRAKQKKIEEDIDKISEMK